MVEVIRLLPVCARRRIRQARGFQLECLQVAIPEDERILQEPANPEVDRIEIHRELVDFLIRLDAGGLFERLTNGKR